MIEPILTWVRATNVSVVDGSRLDVRLSDESAVTVLVEIPSPETFALVTGWLAPPVLLQPEPPVTLGALAEAAAGPRSGLLDFDVHPDRIAIRMTVYREGLNRQSFLEAVGEVGRAYESLVNAGRRVAAQVALLEEERASVPAPAAAGGAADRSLI